MREGNCFGRGGHACGFLFNFSKGRYLFNWGVGPELRRGGSLVNILQIGGGGRVKPVLYAAGEGRSIFCKDKITPCRLVDSYLFTNTRSA